MASGREVSLPRGLESASQALRLWFIAKIPAGGTLDSAVTGTTTQIVSEDLAYDACQHCPHLWIQNRSLENLYL